MDFSTEYLDERINKLKSFKFPKIKLPKINFNDMEKPPRWVVVTIAVLIEIILMFFILWLFDERTVFDNDYKATRYSGEYMKWGWVHMGVTITLVLGAIGWFFAIIGEFAAWKEDGRTFYKFYR